MKQINASTIAVRSEWWCGDSADLKTFALAYKAPVTALVAKYLWRTVGVSHCLDFTRSI